jgi:hypothetical protein
MRIGAARQSISTVIAGVIRHGIVRPRMAQRLPLPAPAASGANSA